MPKAKPSLNWSTPAAIAYGTALGASQLNATVNIAGNYIYTPSAGTVLAAGNHTLNVVFTPTDRWNYTISAMDVSIEIAKASPLILTIPTAAGLNFGQTLADASLNSGSANVPGNFAFASPGTQPSAGNSTHAVIFTPTDTGNYTTASANVTLKVNELPAASTPSPSFGAPAPSGGTAQFEKTKKGKSSKKSLASKSKSTNGSPAQKSGAKKSKKKKK
jgi:hypothetical protein